jgi:hypothetical protein
MSPTNIAAPARNERTSTSSPGDRGVIADASAIPASLGVNPSLTISAVALRSVQEWLDTDLRLEAASQAEAPA